MLGRNIQDFVRVNLNLSCNVYVCTMFSNVSTTTKSNQQVALTCNLIFSDDTDSTTPGKFEVCVLAPTSNKLIANTTRLSVMGNLMCKVKKNFQLK